MLRRHYLLLTFTIMSGVLFTFFLIFHQYTQSEASFARLIDGNFIDELSNSKRGANVLINSTGGDPDFGEKAAKIILKKGLSIEIQNLCVSSCAEYILPAANSLSLSEHALIGFHQNPLMIKHLQALNNGTTLPICYFEDNQIFISNLHKTKLGKNDFWRHVLVKLEVQKVQVVLQLNECEQIGFKFKNAMWFPTGDQLREQYGLRFTGSICADHKSCYQKKTCCNFSQRDIHRRWKFRVYHPMTLFRTEALDHKRRKLHGEVIIVQPVHNGRCLYFYF